MTDSLYMPNLEVEIAFNAGFTGWTGAAPAATPPEDRVWTDVSDFVELSASDVVVRRGAQAGLGS